MKKTTLILATLLLAASLTACGKKADLPVPKPDTNAADTNKTNDPKTDSEITPASIEKVVADAIGTDNYLCDTDGDLN